MFPCGATGGAKSLAVVLACAKAAKTGRKERVEAL
jgi:hypothetical protein